MFTFINEGRRTDETVHHRDAGYHGALASGASTTFGFLGSTTGTTNPVPSPITCTPL
ncbi:hypothetical protein HH310_31350 [Actinoplanes sp. TBRC 11911]|uniref:hypothetical protein n=1 Tax=Actinoplanes sp. TBRC 11911 TaxID=2729386 RepID=UPI00145EE953|nr:hypothetical protein [Actinoplanes sp. TBRC 11911]NMO55667.1 hypothetical protein [Actinoplanes sp. TBRC 11911]